MEAPGPPAPPRAFALPGPPGGRKSRQQEGEAPDAHLAEEGKRVIRELVARQTDVTLSLQQQQSRERQFARASAVVPLSGAPTGTASLRDFSAATRAEARRDQLAALGLSRRDVQLLLDQETGASQVGRLTEPERLAQAEKLRSLQEVVARREETGASSSTGSRHLDELASTLPQGGAHSQFVRLGLGAGASAASRDLPPAFREAASHLPDHPLQRLHGLERELVAKPPPAATSRKRRKMRRAIERLCGEGSPPGTAATGSPCDVPGGDGASSLWDVRTTVRTPPKPSAEVVERRPHGPHRPKQYTIREGKIVEVGRGAREGQQVRRHALRAGAVPSESEGCVTITDIRASRLSLEEIRQLPRFANYEEGTASSVLYVKNLSNDVTEDDLASVFGCFRKPSDPSLVFRLCGGRMRGQAFVTFPSEKDATEALSEVNGYHLRGRPMIVQFGRSPSQT